MRRRRSPVPDNIVRNLPLKPPCPTSYCSNEDDLRNRGVKGSFRNILSSPFLCLVPTYITVSALKRLLPPTPRKAPAASSHLVSPDQQASVHTVTGRIFGLSPSSQPPGLDIGEYLPNDLPKVGHTEGSPAQVVTVTPTHKRKWTPVK